MTQGLGNQCSPFPEASECRYNRLYEAPSAKMVMAFTQKVI
ncbi:hypothetical protein [Shewanella canadensis]|nr:hypothetical protein [Shewanella canadensis]